MHKLTCIGVQHNVLHHDVGTTNVFGGSSITSGVVVSSKGRRGGGCS